MCSAKKVGAKSQDERISELEDRLSVLASAVAELAADRLARSGIAMTAEQGEARAWQVLQEMLPGMSPVSVLGRAKRGVEKKEGLK